MSGSAPKLERSKSWYGILSLLILLLIGLGAGWFSASLYNGLSFDAYVGTNRFGFGLKDASNSIPQITTARFKDYGRKSAHHWDVWLDPSNINLDQSRLTGRTCPQTRRVQKREETKTRRRRE